MASIVDKLKKKIVAEGKSASGVQTISEAMKVLGGERKGEDIAKNIDASDITISKKSEETS